MMDSEPGRCRRTDGKKWRCYKSVVPHQKYCERHMHRGRQRSRKHVEISEAINKSTTLAINSDNFAASVISSSAATTDRGIFAPVSTSLNLAVSCSNAVTVKSVPGTFKGDSASYVNNGIWECKCNTVVRVNNGTTAGSLVRVLADKNNAKYEIDCTGGKGLNFNHISTNKSDWNNLGNKNYCDATVAPGFGLSPKSVLQGGKAAGCSRLNFDSKALAETEPLRCRRTDGKKWRCSRDVVPDKKYCETHLHRGAKKATVDCKLVTNTPAAPIPRSIDTFHTATKVENIINLNTNLSISMAASPQKTSDGDSGSFSSSDATTVTDENGSIAQILTLSP
ncbi:hypothetical protein ACH5RR_000292 [Cinchona calisaya]|uniref:Growth-regulating factor n=1 Tax=Cinchona calisaya TaxID=153742 RepID=A0ABD3B0F4_9GENT